jgi:hypothetical protein
VAARAAAARRGAARGSQREAGEAAGKAPADTWHSLERRGGREASGKWPARAAGVTGVSRGGRGAGG